MPDNQDYILYLTLTAPPGPGTGGQGSPGLDMAAFRRRRAENPAEPVGLSILWSQVRREI